MGKKALPTDKDKDKEILTKMAARIIELNPRCARYRTRSECLDGKVSSAVRRTDGSLLSSAAALAKQILAKDDKCKSCTHKSDACVFRIVRFYVSGMGMASGKECVKK